MGNKNKFEFNKEKLLEVLSRRAEGFFYHEEILEYGEREIKKSKTDEVNREHEENLKSYEKDVSLLVDSTKTGVYSARKTKAQGINKNFLEMENCDENSEGLVLLKKKVTTHYVPPDLTAVKMLLENFGEKVKSNDFVDELNDDELITLRDEILSQIKS